MSLGNSSVHQSGEIPEITKLPNGRIRVVRRFVKFTREDVDNVNLGSLLGDFGDLDITGEQVTNQGYTNCRLIEVEVETSTKRSAGSDSSNSVLVQTYETLTDSFVEITDPTISYGENGLKQVTKVSRAVSGTTSSNVVGTTFIPVDPNADPLVPDVWLASYQIEDNTAFAELTEVYIEAGILSKTIDKVGSQQSTIIESIKFEPTAPAGYVLANQQKSEFEGLQTNRFTFLKPDVELSNSEDNVGSENRITEQWFKPSIVVGTNPVTVDRRIKAGYSLARKQVSDVEGIPTEEYTFLKDNVVLSVSQDRVGSQLAVTNEVFKPASDAITGVDVTGVALVGYSEANRQKSDFGGIPTIKYSFLKNDVQLSKSDDNVGSQLAEIEEWFNPSLVAGGDPATVDRRIKTGYSLAKEEESDVGGIPTARYTFLKNNVQLSESEDKVGSQNAITEEWFKPVTGTLIPADNRNVKTNYSLAKEEASDVEGIPTARYTFLKDNVLLSESEDKVGSQNTITEEWFKPVIARKTKAGYSIGKEEASDVAGIPTERYTFLETDVNLSTSSDKVGSQLAIVEEWFKPSLVTGSGTVDRRIKTGYVIGKEETADTSGIPTSRYTFLKSNVKLSESSDKVGSQLTIIEEWFKPVTGSATAADNRNVKTGYSLAREEASDVGGIPTERYTFLKNDVKLSESEDRVGSQNATVEEWFNPIISDPIAVPPVVGRDQKAGYSLARSEVSDVQGIPTARYTFLENNVKLSESRDKVGSQLAITEEWFNPTAQPTILGYVIGDSRESDFDGIPTEKYTFLKEDVNLSTSSDKVGSQLAITEEWFKPSLIVGTNPATVDRRIKVGYELAKDDISDTDGIPTARYTFLKPNVKLSDSVDKVGSQNSTSEQWFKPVTDSGTPADNRNVKAGYSLAREEVSDVEGIPTARYTFLKDDVQLSESLDKVGSQNATVEEWFKPVTGSATAADNRNVKTGYSLAKEEVSDVGGIPTARYTFLEPSILSLQQELDDGFKSVTVRVFALTPAQAAAKINSIITTNHKLSSKEESDYEGIKTSIFKYQINESFTEDYELNGLKRISQTELSDTSFSARIIGGVAGIAATPPASDPPNVVPSGSPVIGLYLSTQEIDNGGAIKTRTSTWIESGTLQQEKRNISDGLVEYTTKYIAAQGASVGPIVDESIENFEGLNVFTVVDIRNSAGADPIGGTPVAVNSFSSKVPFKYAGVVSAQHDQVFYGTAADDFRNVLSFVMRPPVEVTVLAEVNVYLQNTGTIVASDFTSGSSVGYWNPTSWAEVYQGGYAWGGTPFSETQGLRGYRVDNDISGIQTFDNTGTTRQYLSNGVTISNKTIDSLDAFNVEQFEYTNNGGFYVPSETLWTGQTSNAKGIAKLIGSRDSGVFGFSRTGAGTNTTPFQVGETVTTSAQFQGNPKTLGRSIGDATYVIGTSDSNGYSFSLNSKKIYASTPFQMKLSGGPENPSNKKWVLDVKMEPAFQDVAGVKYYRKTIVTANIP